MAEDPKPEPTDEDRMAIPLDPEDALKALLKVDPAEPVNGPRPAAGRPAEPTS
jgi:hypothetical protein